MFRDIPDNDVTTLNPSLFFADARASGPHHFSEIRRRVQRAFDSRNYHEHPYHTSRTSTAPGCDHASWFGAAENGGSIPSTDRGSSIGLAEPWLMQSPKTDASLIATAPDMYEVLDSVENDDTIPNGLWEEIQIVLRRARGDHGLIFSCFGIPKVRHIRNQDWLKFVERLWKRPGDEVHDRLSV